MGILKFFKKQMTSEELEEKRKKEQEWADKCVKAGERFGNRIDLNGKIITLNDFANTYPKTFFSIFMAVIVFGFVTNLFFSGMGNIFHDTAKDLKIATLEKDTGMIRLGQDIDRLYKEYINLGETLDKKLSQVVLSHNDSLEVLNICQRMGEIERLLNAGMGGGTPSNSQNREDISYLEQELDRMEAKENKTAEDTVYIRSLLDKINTKIKEQK